MHRASGIGATGARHATDPINAMLNLAYAKEAGRLGVILAASGACLAIGFLHQDKVHRHSLVFDALEPLRPLIDAKVRAFIGSNTFDRGDFLRLSTGHVRMVPGLIKVVLEKTVLPESDIKSAADFMLGLILPLRATRRVSKGTASWPVSFGGNPVQIPIDQMGMFDRRGIGDFRHVPKFGNPVDFLGSSIHSRFIAPGARIVSR
jgi:CRISPR associated protein Cas1